MNIPYTLLSHTYKMMWKLFSQAIRLTFTSPGYHWTESPTKFSKACDMNKAHSNWKKIKCFQAILLYLCLVKTE